MNDGERLAALEAKMQELLDRQAIFDKVKAWTLAANIDVVITTGGTGFTGRDVTPEALEPWASLMKTRDNPACRIWSASAS